MGRLKYELQMSIYAGKKQGYNFPSLSWGVLNINRQLRKLDRGSESPEMFKCLKNFLIRFGILICTCFSFDFLLISLIPSKSGRSLAISRLKIPISANTSPSTSGAK